MTIDTSERFMHNLLRLVADHPGAIGRLRACRIVGGYAVPRREDYPIETDAYAISGYDAGLQELVELTDAGINGGLLKQTPGIRPTLVLTRTGFSALAALDSI